MAESLRIAVYHNLHSGGAKHSLYEIVRRLAGRHRVDLFCTSTADTDFFDPQEFVEDNIVFEFRPGRLFRSPFGRLNQAVRWRDLTRLEQVQRQIAAEIDGRGYDVVYVHPCQFTQSPSVLRYLRTPSLYHSREPFRRLHEPTIPRPYRNTGHWRLLDRIDPLPKVYDRQLRQVDARNARLATLVVTNSYFTREALYRIYGVNASVVYHGVDRETFRPLGLAREPFVLSVGALTPAKGFDFIIESLGHIAASIRPELVIVSNYQEPQERAYLESLAAEKQVRLAMLTMIEVDELVRLYNTARVTVYAPVMEPFGLVSLESMACGTPVVGVREGGVRESVVNGQTGILVDRVPEAFAQAVRTLLEDRELVRRYGAQARKYVSERWTWEQAVERIERHLLLTAAGMAGA
jgi:glycosyltransferase involved in cell wall biosynthesis